MQTTLSTRIHVILACCIAAACAACMGLALFAGSAQAQENCMIEHNFNGTVTDNFTVKARKVALYDTKAGADSNLNSMFGGSPTARDTSADWVSAVTVKGKVSAKNINTIIVKSDVKFEKAKSSNKKVATVKLSKSKKILTITYKKAGKTTISYAYDGKSHKQKLVVYKYKNPVKLFKVGSKNYTSEFNDKASFMLKKWTEAKVLVKPAAGWKLLLKSNVYDTDYSVMEDALQPGSLNSMQLHKNDYAVNFVLQNKKTGVVQRVTVWQPYTKKGGKTSFQG